MYPNGLLKDAINNRSIRTSAVRVSHDRSSSNDANCSTSSNCDEKTNADQSSAADVTKTSDEQVRDTHAY